MLDTQDILTGYRFSTKDRDIVSYFGQKCSKMHSGGWWYQEEAVSVCTTVNPNGRYYLGIGDSMYASVFWFPTKESFKGMKSVTMKIKYFWLHHFVNSSDTSRNLRISSYVLKKTHIFFLILTSELRHIFIFFSLKCLLYLFFK